MRFAKACTLLLMVAGFVSAQPIPAQRPTVLVLHPQAAPVPALKYPLLPDITDMHPGNAALYYHRAMLLRCLLRPKAADQQQLYKWLETPLKDLPRADVRAALKQYRDMLREVDFAARCTSINWGLEQRKEGLHLLMPEIQEMRPLIQVVALQARLDMAERHFDQAVHGLQTGYAMSRQVGESANSLIATLVGVALGAVMDQQVEQFVQLQGAPNLYWSLTQLPRPFVPLRPGLEGDKTWFWDTFPQLKRLETETLSAAEVNRVVASMFPELGSAGMGNDPSTIRLGLAALTIKSYPMAKRWLTTEGKSAAEIDAMPALQAVVRYSLFQYRRWQDELYKWAYLPRWEAEPGLEKAMAQFKRAKSTLADGIPFAWLFLPAMQRVTFASTSLDQRHAALRIVEAVRLYAASHDGQLPVRLDAIRDVPIPIDPVSGKSFQYQRTGNTALLTGPALPGRPFANSSLNYELRIAHGNDSTGRK